MSPAAQREMKMSGEELWDVEERARKAALPLGSAFPAPRGSVASLHPQSHSWLGCGHLPHCSPPLCTSFCRQMHRTCPRCTRPAPTPCSLTSHTHLTSSQTHLAHLFPGSFLLCYRAFLQHLQEKIWKWNVSCKSLWHNSRQCSGTKKIRFFSDHSTSANAGP